MCFASFVVNCGADIHMIELFYLPHFLRLVERVIGFFQVPSYECFMEHKAKIRIDWNPLLNHNRCFFFDIFLCDVRSKFIQCEHYRPILFGIINNINFKCPFYSVIEHFNLPIIIRRSVYVNIGSGTAASSSTCPPHVSHRQIAKCLRK